MTKNIASIVSLIFSNVNNYQHDHCPHLSVDSRFLQISGPRIAKIMYSEISNRLKKNDCSNILILPMFCAVS